MKSIHFKDKIGGAILAFSRLFGIGIASSLTAQAQYRDDQYGQIQRDRNRDWRRERARRHDRDRDGDWDRDRDRRNDNDYRYGNNGGYGNNGRYGGYNNNNIYRAALNNGYQAGVYTGASDAQRGQSYDPQRSHYYKNGTDGYNSSYGNKGQYKQAYRDGFLRGYQEGFQRYGGYNNRGGYGNGRNYPSSRSRTGSILGEIFGRP